MLFLHMQNQQGIDIPMQWDIGIKNEFRDKSQKLTERKIKQQNDA